MEQKKFEIKLLSHLQPASERIDGERETRRIRRSNIIPFGISFLDEAMGGIKNDDVILVSAGSGAGKTEIATFMATQAARAGQRVCYFALEASINEIESRIKYRMLSEAYYSQKTFEYRKPIRYLDWNYGRLEKELGPFELEIDEQFREVYQTLATYYKNSTEYTIDHFEKQFLAMKEVSDLFVIDHLHYIDHGDDANEIVALRRIVKEISNLANTHSKPVILVAHIRKIDKRYSLPVPSLDDIYGSSDVSKISTKAIMLARCEPIKGSPIHKIQTYMRILKDRNDGSLSMHTAVVNFDQRKNTYDNKYFLGNFKGTEWSPYSDKNRIPYWAVSCENKTE